MIPRIIHQTGPADPSLYNNLWIHGQSEWKRLYQGFEYYLWDDDDIDAFMVTYYPQYVDNYRSLPLHIHQIDISRLFLLHKYGGIYADLDYIPYTNFYRRLDNSFNIVESSSSREVVQNCLMASPAGTDDMLGLIDHIFHACNTVPFVDISTCGKKALDAYVLKTSGPNAIGSYIDNMEHFKLDQSKFNAFGLSKIDSEVVGSHHLTGVWGNTTLDRFSDIDEFKEFHANWFFRNRASFEFSY